MWTISMVWGLRSSSADTDSTATASARALMNFSFPTFKSIAIQRWKFSTVHETLINRSWLVIPLKSESISSNQKFGLAFYSIFHTFRGRKSAIEFSKPCGSKKSIYDKLDQTFSWWSSMYLKICSIFSCLTQKTFKSKLSIRSWRLVEKAIYLIFAKSLFYLPIRVSV